MEYGDTLLLLTQKEPLTGKQAIEIINSWRLAPESYQMLINTKGLSIPLRGYVGYSPNEEHHLFKETDKLILAPNLACKFFELESDELTAVFLETLDYLTFASDEDNDEDDDEDNDEDNDEDDDENCGFYAWPYLMSSAVNYLSAEIIEGLLFNWNYVFDWEFDDHGRFYSLFYNKMHSANKCCDMLAAGSFNLFNWIGRDEFEPEILAKHYCFANYALWKNGNTGEAYFRKCLVHYLGAMLENVGEIVNNIRIRRLARFN